MKIKQGSNTPSLLAFPDRDGVRVPNIDTASSVTFKMFEKDSPAILVTGVMVINDTNTAEVQYNWAAGDTAVEGEYNAEVVILWPGGGSEIFPNEGWERVTVTPAVEPTP